jgi:hypothetical protein
MHGYNCGVYRLIVRRYLGKCGLPTPNGPLPLYVLICSTMYIAVIMSLCQIIEYLYSIHINLVYQGQVRFLIVLTGKFA